MRGCVLWRMIPAGSTTDTAPTAVSPAPFSREHRRTRCRRLGLAERRVKPSAGAVLDPTAEGLATSAQCRLPPRRPAEGLDHGAVERWDVVRLAARDQVVVHHDRLIHPFRPGV